MAFGIALAGGGTRGSAHVGVLKALEEKGIRPRSISGTSAGSIVAGLYACGVPVSRLEEMVLTLTKDGRSLIDIDFLGMVKSVFRLCHKCPSQLSGFIKGNRIEKWLMGYVGDKTLRDSQIPLVIPAVDIPTGDTIVFTSSLAPLRLMEGVQWKTQGNISDIIRASISFPVVFQPKVIEGYYLVDGGVTDVLPVDLLIAAGEPNVLAVDISQKYSPSHKENLVEIAHHSLTIMQTRLKERTSTGERLSLRPALPEKAGLLTFSYMEECMQAGYDATMQLLPTIQRLMAE